MIVNQDFVNALNPKENEIILISHPGFYRPPWKLRLFLYFRDPYLLASDIYMKIRTGGIGAWEKNKDSSAYVMRQKRANYICGGFWGGDKKMILALTTVLENEVIKDLKNGIVAKWHDESHLNSWASKNKFRLENPSYCHDSTYQNIGHLEKIITAVRKAPKER